MRRPDPIPRAEKKAADSPREEKAAQVLTLPRRRDDADSEAAPAGRSAESPAEDGVGLRAVWRAARARRRALRVEARRFTARIRRRRRVWIGVSAALLLLVIGSVGAAYSPLFAVEDVRVVGTERLDAAELKTALESQVGTPLALVDASEIKAALVGFPLVESYTIEARPPHELVVRVVERTAVGAVASAAGYTVVDAAGVALSTTDAPPEGQPVIEASGGVGSDAFIAAGQMLRAVPGELRERIVSVTAQSPEDVRFLLGDTGTEVRWGNAEDSALKALVLKTFIQARSSAPALVDVSSPDALVAR